MDLRPKIEASFFSPTRSVLSVCFSPDQTKLCSAGFDKKVILTNLKNYTKKVFIGHYGSIYGSDFSSNGNSFATASADFTSRIWNVENGNSRRLVGHSSCVYCIRYFHKDPTKVISGSADNRIKIWDIEFKSEITTLRGCEGTVHSVDLLPDNQTIVSGSGDKNHKLRIWDFRSGKCVRMLDHHKNRVNSVQFHQNTYCLASGSFDKTIKIFDFRTFELLQNYQEHTQNVLSVCFHPSGKYLLSGSDDKTIKLFDLSQKEVVFTLNGHSGAVNSVQFSPDGKTFASGSDDNKVLIWNNPLKSKDVDEEERVNYLIVQDLLSPPNSEDDCCERNVLKIRIDDFCDLYCYKFLFVY